MFVFRSFVGLGVVLSAVTSAPAVSLVVMNVATHATDSNIPLAEQVVTFGIRVTQDDLIGAGTNPVLFVQNLTFAGNGIVPLNGSFAASNKVDVQSIQRDIIDPIAQSKGSPATFADLTPKNAAALYQDSWWYQGQGTFGVLQGVNNASGNVGNLTDSAWQPGPIAAIGSTGFEWTPNGALGVQAGATADAAAASMSGSNATTGQYMMYSGFYGPNGANSLTGSILSQQFINGVLTVPLAQIVTTGDIRLPGDNAHAGGGSSGNVGFGTLIGVAGNGVSNGPTGNGMYNILGGNPGQVDQGFAYYSYQYQTVAPPLPEPSSLILAALGVLMLPVVRRLRQTPRCRVTDTGQDC